MILIGCCAQELRTWGQSLEQEPDRSQLLENDKQRASTEGAQESAGSRQSRIRVSAYASSGEAGALHLWSRAPALAALLQIEPPVLRRVAIGGV